MNIKPLIPAFVSGFLAVAGAPAHASEAGASDWAEGKLSAARLLSAGGLDHGTYRAGIDIKLDGGAHTYWRNPGDAGVPPTINFDSSINLAAARVQFPAPTRIVEDGQDVFGYLGSVIWTVAVTPRDPAKPVELALELQYAACARICIPADARATLTLEPKAAATAFAEDLKRARAAVPVPAGGPKILARSAAGGAKPSWIVSVDPTPGANADLFAEAPEGWYFSTKRRSDGAFDLVAEQQAAESAGAVDLTLTYVDGARAFETPLRLDLAGPAR